MAEVGSVRGLLCVALLFLHRGDIFIHLVCSEERRGSMRWCLRLGVGPLGWVQAGQGEEEADQG